MTSTKLDKLEEVAGIALRLEADLRKLKKWICSQYEKETNNVKEYNRMNHHDMTDYDSFESDNDDGTQTGQQPPSPRAGYSGASYFTIPDCIEMTRLKPKSAQGNGGQEFENESESDEEFLPEDSHELQELLSNGHDQEFLPEDSHELQEPLGNEHHEMMDEPVDQRPMECEICHKRYKNRNVLKVHKYYNHGDGAKKRRARAQKKKDEAQKKKEVQKKEATGSKKRKAPSSPTTTIASKGPVKKKPKVVTEMPSTSTSTCAHSCYVCGEKFKNYPTKFAHLQKCHFICGHSGCRLQFTSYQTLMEHKKEDPAQHRRIISKMTLPTNPNFE